MEPLSCHCIRNELDNTAPDVSVSLCVPAVGHPAYSLIISQLCSGGSVVFIFFFGGGGHWGGDTLSWGHTTNTFVLNYRVCNR